MLAVFYFNINGIEYKKLYKQWNKYISKKLLTKIEGYFNEEDKKRSLVGEILLRYALFNIHSIYYDEIEIREDNNGKPYIVNKTNIFFNISHSVNYVICAIGTQNLGIDIEVIKDIDMNLAKRFFCKDEYRNLLKEKKHNRLNLFYTLWCLKESYVKYTGQGLKTPFNSFSFNISNKKIEFKKNSIEIQPTFELIDIDLDYKAAICYEEKKGVQYVKQVILKDLVLLD